MIAWLLVVADIPRIDSCLVCAADIRAEESEVLLNYIADVFVDADKRIA